MKTPIRMTLAFAGLAVLAASCSGDESPSGVTTGAEGVAGEGGGSGADEASPSATGSPGCTTGQTLCGNSCVDTATNSAHCGACSNACPAGMACAGGECACQAGLVECGGQCVNLQADPANCGACAVACAAVQGCVNGACTCPGSTSLCGGLCVDTSTDINNCGTCGLACSVGQLCQGGACLCQGGLTDCAGTCADLQSDAANCGACGQACPPGQVCSLGACSAQCAAGLTQCGQSCVDVNTSVTHCGACDAACPPGLNCTGGSCGCAAGQTLCDGACVDTSTSLSHCGACGQACAAGQACTAGVCTCPAGQTFCGTSCVDTQTDLANCGACGNQCGAATTCTAGACTAIGSGGSGGSATGGSTGQSSGGAADTPAGGSGGAAAGGTEATGGDPATGGASTGGQATGGDPATGGEATGGEGTGGEGTGGEGTGGEGTGGSTSPTEGPCDIYAADNAPCVGAYSMVRVLSSEYTGPLYQVRRGGGDPNYGSGGETLDIGFNAQGFADAAAQDEFCAGATCTVSVLYDHSGIGNNLTVAPAGCYTGGDGAAAEADWESLATTHSLTVSGNDVYALYMDAHEGYRNNDAVGTAEGEQPQGVYMVADGTHWGVACCWDFGTASRDNCYGPTGMMATLLFGTAWWGRGEGNGPWFMGDFEAGVWAGGSSPGDPGYGAIEACDANDANCPPNNDNPSLPVPYAFGILETSAGQYALRMGDATSGTLHTAYDGAAPQPWILEGGIILGIGGDNSNWSYGTFYEGCITAGRPTLEAQEAVYRNVQEAGYGQ